MARILHVITGLNVGGAETMLYKVLSASSGHLQHVVVSLMPTGPLASRIAGLGVPVHSLKLRAALPNPARIWALRSFARRLSPDLIAGWMYHGNLMASFAGWGLQVPVIWGIRSSLPDLDHFSLRTAAVIRLGGLMSRHSAGIIYPGHTSRIQHEKRGYHAAKSVVIHNGVNCAEFVPDEHQRARFKSELGLPENTVLVGLVARRHSAKNQPGFLHAAALVARSQPDARFLLVGRGIGEDSGLRQLVQKLDLQDRVLFYPEHNDMPRITASFDIACSASVRESFPNAIAEAMSCAVPCAVTSVGESAFLVGDTGIPVAADDPQALAAAIIQLITMGPDSRRHLGARARRRIEENFSLPAIVARYEDFYDQHLSCNSSGAPAGDVGDLDPAIRE